MSTQLAKTNGNGHLDPAIIESLVLGGDVGKLTPTQKVQYVGYRCKQLGLDPAAQPFQLLRLQGKEVLYATAAATQQLCQSRGLSVQITKREVIDGIYCVEARVSDKDGRFTENMGTVPLDGLKGEVRSNAMLKCTTKAIRRTVLAHCGLGVMDETEAETIPGAERVPQGRGNPLRQEFAALSYELDACKSQEQIDLLLDSPEFKDFEARDNQSSGMSFAGMMRDKAEVMKKKLPERIRYEGNKIVATTHMESEIASASRAGEAAGQSGAAPPRSDSADPPPSPVEEILPEYSELVSGFFDRIDLAESEAELKEISGAIVERQTELSEQDKKALSNAWKQRKRTIAAKVDA